MSSIIESIISSVKSDFTKSEEAKKEMIDFLTNAKLFKKSTDHLQMKFDALISLIKFIETNVPESHCKIYGSFVRQMFEKMFLSTYDSTGYGDSENHDIDMHVFESKELFETHHKEFSDIIDTFEVMSNLDFTAGIKFGEFYVVNIQDLSIQMSDKDDAIHSRLNLYRKQLDTYIANYNTRTENPISIDDERLPSRSMMRYRVIMNRLEASIKDKFNNVPHYNIILKNPETNSYVILDLFAYPIDSNEYDITKDIDVNTLSLTRNGIQSKTNFLTTINSISKHHGVMQINMKQMIEDLETKSLTFNAKAKIYNQIVNFMGFRTKILSVGYNSIFSNEQMGDFYIEKKSDCPITGAHAPYVCIKMKCGHPLTVMALSGLVNIKASEYSEFVGCPSCRAKLIPAMIEQKPKKIEIPDPSIVSKIFTSGESRRNSISLLIPKYVQNEIMAGENVSTVLEHLGLKPKIEKE
jgi:hypothetical protein